MWDQEKMQAGNQHFLLMAQTVFLSFKSKFQFSSQFSILSSVNGINWNHSTFLPFGEVLDKLLAINSITHKSRASNHQRMFWDSHVPLLAQNFSLNLFLNNPGFKDP